MLSTIKGDNVLGKGTHREYEWVVVNNGMGYRCGYVRIPKGHPWHGKDYDDVGATVHGGLTYARGDINCEDSAANESWWIGFDCAHAGDAPDPVLSNNRHLTPYESFFLSMDCGDSSGTIRTQAFVEAECQNLCEQAEQAAAITNN